MDSTLYLLSNVPLRNDYQHTIDFDNLQAQQIFFDSLISNVEMPNDDYSYIRETEIINVYKNKDDLINCNYLFYDNGGKRYYAFITSKEYVSDECTAITFEIDVMQTFMFDYTIGETFIEREHQDRYIEIENNKLQPVFSRTRESLERGDEMKMIDSQMIADGNNTSENVNLEITWLTVITKEKLNGTYYWYGGAIELDNVLPTMVNGLPNNTYSYVVPFIINYNKPLGKTVNFYCKTQSGSSHTTAKILTNQQLYELSKNPNVISISSSFYAPFEYEILESQSGNVIDYTIEIWSQTMDGTYYLCCFNQATSDYNGAMLLVVNISLPSATKYTKIDNDLTINKNALLLENPKNIMYEPKLYTQDYQYKLLSYGGESIKLYNENFSKKYIDIYYINPLSVKMGQCFLIDYYNTNENGTPTNFEQSLYFNANLFELPLLTDAWLTYLQNNKNSLITGQATNAISTLGGLAIGAFTGGVGFAVAGTTALNYGMQIANQMAQIKDIKERPDELKNITGDINIENIKGMKLKLKTYQIHDQFRNRIFNYFYHFGYLANYFATPNIKSRYYFNYIKTVGANIISNIDNNHIDNIKSIFDNGITIWHYRNMETWHGVGNYFYENVETNLIGGNND